MFFALNELHLNSLKIDMDMDMDIIFRVIRAKVDTESFRRGEREEQALRFLQWWGIHSVSHTTIVE